MASHNRALCGLLPVSFFPEGAVKGNQLEPGRAVSWPLAVSNRSPFKYFRTSPEIIRLAVMLYVRLPLSLRNVEDLRRECGIDVSHDTVRELLPLDPALID